MLQRFIYFIIWLQFHNCFFQERTLIWGIWGCLWCLASAYSSDSCLFWVKPPYRSVSSEFKGQAWMWQDRGPVADTMERCVPYGTVKMDQIKHTCICYLSGAIIKHWTLLITAAHIILLLVIILYKCEMLMVFTACCFDKNPTKNPSKQPARLGEVC